MVLHRPALGYHKTMPITSDSPVLWYFADPMCSWCWGFSPVVAQVKQKFSDHVKIALNLGGLRPGTTEPLPGKMREEILHHWQEVHRLTGQTFTFENAMPEGFIYDTEPSCRAVLAFARLQPTEALFYFATIQSAFYTEGCDVTRANVLTDLTRQYAVDADEFETLFHSGELREVTQAHFKHTRQAGVSGFPTLMWQAGDKIEVLCTGYRPYASLSEQIREKLK